jgi:uncharacterized protein (DUF2141 family)
LLPPGTYAVTVTATNYTGDSASGLAVPINGTKTKDFALVPLPGTLQGVVTSTNPAGTPIVGATVKLADGTLATTDATGTYRLTLAPGTYAVTVTATNYSGNSASGLVVPSAGTRTQNFTLTPLPGALQGVVTSTNPGGAPIAGATVKLADGTPATTDAKGAYTFTSLPPGTYAVTVTAANYNGASAAGLVVASAGTTTKDFSLTPLPPPDPCKAATDFFALGAAAGYTLLTIGTGGCNGWSDITLYGGSLIGGTGGLGGNTGTWMKDTTFQGRVFVDSDALWTKKLPYKLLGGSAVLNLDSTVNTAIAASNRFAALKATQKLGNITTTTTITGNGGVNVISIPYLKIVNGTLTIKGGASDVFVINVSGKFELDASKMVLTGGVPQCAILWNFTGNWVAEANEVELENGSTGIGTFLAPERLVDFQRSTLIGKVLAGGQVIVNASTVKPQ